MKEIKKQYEEYLEENKLKDSIENINKFIISLHYKIMYYVLNDESVEEKINKILNEK